MNKLFIDDNIMSVWFEHDFWFLAAAHPSTILLFKVT